MLEHVGRDYFPALAHVIDRVLAPDRGRGLLHFIGRNTPAPLHPWIERRIFPGAYPPTLAEVAEGVFAPARLTILDAENLRLHYARTLQHWLARFEAARRRGDGDVRRRVRARVAVVSGGIDRELRHGLAAVVPGDVRPRARQQHPVDAGDLYDDRKREW